MKKRLFALVMVAAMILATLASCSTPGGGGSSDGAAVLNGLNEMLSLSLSKDTLCEIAAPIGADIPFCIHGGIKRTKGIGEIIIPIDSDITFNLVIVKPDFGVATGRIYDAYYAVIAPAHPDIDGLVEALNMRSNVRLLTGTTVTALEGDSELTGIRVSTAGKETLLPVDGLFIAIGHMPDNEAFRPLLQLDEAGYAASGEDCLTETPGLFVAGDCRAKAVRQVTTAAADGAVAALAACHYLDA